MKIVADHRFDNPHRLELIRELVAFNNRVGPPERWDHVGFYAVDDEGALAGGLQGAFEWDWLHVSHLWVREPRQGVGSWLIGVAEAHALANGRKGLFLDTLGFQARGFYEKLGFALLATIDDAAGHHARHFMIKRL